MLSEQLASFVILRRGKLHGLLLVVCGQFGVISKYSRLECRTRSPSTCPALSRPRWRCWGWTSSPSSSRWPASCRTRRGRTKWQRRWLSIICPPLFILMPGRLLEVVPSHQRERERARESQREPVRARERQRESQKEPQRVLCILVGTMLNCVTFCCKMLNTAFLT